MRITTKSISSALDKPVNHKDLRRGQVVWTEPYGLCLIAQENKDTTLFLVNMVSGSVYTICKGDKIFDMDKYYECNVEHNYPSFFEKE
jgi:hypothetical protein